jgi:ADP-ribose pyrophosphatase
MRNTARIGDLCGKRRKQMENQNNEGKKATSALKQTQDTDTLAWEEVWTEHIIQDEWIDFRKSAYRLPDGKVFEPYYTYSRRSYVVIVASDTEGRYLCVHQFRQGIRQVTCEFPAGGIERKSEDGKQYGDLQSGEDALTAAKRELAEETGYESDEWSHLLTVPSNATMADNYVYLFRAKNCRKVANLSLDETEFLNVKQYSANEIEDMIANGNFQQAVHILAWMLSRRVH